MNRGVLQSSPVQQMMAAGNPSWWNINNLMRPPMMSTQHPGHGNGHHGYHQQLQQLSPSSSSSTTTNFLNSNSCSSNNDTISINNETNSLFQAHPYMNINMATTPSSSSCWLDDHTNNQDNHHHSHLPESWSQLLMGGVCMGEEEDQAKKIERWEDQVVINQHTNHHVATLVDHHHQVKQETSSAMDGYGNGSNINVYGAVATANHDQEFQIAAVKAANNWSSPSQLMNNNNNNNNNNIIPTSSPQSCVTTFSSSNCNSVLDFSSSKSSTDSLHANHPVHERSSECNSTANGGVLKKAKVQPSSTQSTFKVRKEKLGDRITALHQLVSPFGKTDTASVLLEAIGYIRFLQSQIEALSLPYLSNGAGNKRQPHPVQGERNCIFPEDPGQLLNDNCLKRKGGPEQDSYEEAKDLRSRGLCLVPVSCTLHVGSDNGADYWAPALGGGFR